MGAPILVPVDFHQASLDALHFALELAPKIDAKVVLLHVHPLAVGMFVYPGMAPYLIPRFDEELARAAQRSLDALADEKHVAERLLRGGDPGGEILEAAGSIKPSLVVMGTSGRTGLARLFLGSVAARVVRECSQPVLTVRPRSETAVAETAQTEQREPISRARRDESSAKPKILVAVDFEAASKRAVDSARGLADRLGADVILAHVYEPPHFPYPGVPQDVPQDLETKFLAELETKAQSSLRDLAARNGNPPTLFRRGEVAAEILKLVEETAPRMVLMGTHGRRGFRRFFLGSVAEDVVRASAAPVLTVHAPEAPTSS